MTLKKAREEKGLTQEQLAKKLGISTERYVAWEYGRTKIPQRFFDRITEILGTVPDDVSVRQPNGATVKRYGRYEAFRDTVSSLQDVSDKAIISNLVDDMLANWKKDLMEAAGLNK